jgi:hypothetical protein
MLNFTYQGRKFVNGYACDGLGRPITVKSGYSSEDERDAKEAYEEAVKMMKSPKQQTQENKYEQKKQFENTFALDITPEEYEQLFANSRKSENGYMLNEMGQEISLENGYTDEDVEITRKLASREF